MTCMHLTPEVPRRPGDRAAGSSLGSDPIDRERECAGVAVGERDADLLDPRAIQRGTG